MVSHCQGVCSHLLRDHNKQTTRWVSEPKGRPRQRGGHDWADDAHLRPAASIWTTNTDQELKWIRKKKIAQIQQKQGTSLAKLINLWLCMFLSLHYTPGGGDMNTLQINVIMSTISPKSKTPLSDTERKKNYYCFYIQQIMNYFWSMWSKTFLRQILSAHNLPHHDLSFFHQLQRGHWIFPADQ